MRKARQVTAITDLMRKGKMKGLMDQSSTHIYIAAFACHELPWLWRDNRENTGQNWPVGGSHMCGKTDVYQMVEGEVQGTCDLQIG